MQGAERHLKNVNAGGLCTSVAVHALDLLLASWRPVRSWSACWARTVESLLLEGVRSVRGSLWCRGEVRCRGVVHAGGLQSGAGASDGSVAPLERSGQSRRGADTSAAFSLCSLRRFQHWHGSEPVGRLPQPLLPAPPDVAPISISTE